MARWHEDEVDVAAQAWAFQCVQHFLRDPDRAGRTIGPLACTLGRVLERHDGAGSGTEVARRWPEVFLGQGLVVSVALKAMSLGQRELVWRHYIERVYDPATLQPLKRPLKQRIIAARMGISLAEYYTRRDVAKSCIRVAMFLTRKTLRQHAFRPYKPGRLRKCPRSPVQRLKRAAAKQRNITFFIIPCHSFRLRDLLIERGF